MTHLPKHSSSKLVLGAALAIALGAFSAAQAQERPQHREVAFSAADANDDGMVTFDEFSNAQSGRIEKLDSDANGVLTLDEFLNAAPARGRKPEDRSPENLSEEQQRREAMRAERRATLAMKAEERFAEMDSNGDEAVSAAEFLEAGFLRLDTDNNGALTAAELEAGGRKQRGSRGGQREGQKKGQREGRERGRQ